MFSLSLGGAYTADCQVGCTAACYFTARLQALVDTRMSSKLGWDILVGKVRQAALLQLRSVLPK